MFKIRDGREYFYQWDINREILVSDPTVKEVHFCNRTDDCSLVVEVKEVELFADNKLIKVERYAEVPNILLQDNWKIRVYAYCSDNYTKVEQVFNVKSRTKPADYVYTETEVLTYHQLEKRLDDIEANGISDEQIEKAVTNYLNENPIEIPEVNLDGYATEDYVNQEINKIDIPTVPTNVSDFTNDANYATEQYVNDKIDNLDIPEAEVDLSNYYNKEEVDSKLEEVDVEVTVGISDDGNGNVSIQAIEGNNSVDLTNYYDKEEIDTKLDGYITDTELANKGYINSLDGYATESYVNDKFNGANKALVFDTYSDMFQDLNSLDNVTGEGPHTYKTGQNIYIKTLEVPDLWISQTTVLYDSYDYVSDAQVISDLQQNGTIYAGYWRLSALETQKVDLTNYYNKEEVTEEIDNAISEKVVNWGIDETSTTIDLSLVLGSPISVYSYLTPITAINQLESVSPQGMSVQFKSSSTITVEPNSNINWIGDNCSDNVFTPEADTNYEIYSYYNTVLDKVINMVMNLGK